MVRTRRLSVWTVAVVLACVAGVTAPLAAATGTVRTPARCASVAPRGPSPLAGGIQWAGTVGGGQCPSAPARSRGGTAPEPPYRGKPPLRINDGAVAGTKVPGEITVTPVYWVPAGGRFKITTDYKTLVNRFIADVASDSGADTNAFAVLKQYTKSGGQHLQYLIHAGTPVVDTDAFPANGCTPDSGVIWAPRVKYSVCLTSVQMFSEASAFTSAKGLPNNDLAHLYMYFLPKGVENCYVGDNGAAGGTCSVNSSSSPSFCAYHGVLSPPLYAVMEYAFVDSPTGHSCSSDAGSNTDGNQSPNSDVDADAEISTTGHEMIETITDPQGGGWYDKSSQEIADDCTYIYGDSRSFQGPAGAHYNQTINGHHYFLQAMFSNDDFAKAPALSCIQREDTVTVTPAAGAPGTRVTISGGGFATGEKVTVSYATGRASPKSVVVCTANASATGELACSGKIPAAATAGAKGTHTVAAKGTTSRREPTARFALN